MFHHNLFFLLWHYHDHYLVLCNQEELRMDSIERLIVKFAGALEQKRESVEKDAELLRQMQSTQELGE